MKREARHPIWSWIIHTPWVLAVIALLAVVVFFAAHRFLLGTQNFAERTRGPATTCAHPR